MEEICRLSDFIATACPMGEICSKYLLCRHERTKYIEKHDNILNPMANNVPYHLVTSSYQPSCTSIVSSLTTVKEYVTSNARILK